MNCPNGHEMSAVPLKREAVCAGCGDRTGTVYDCEFKCFGECPACALELPGEVPVDSRQPSEES
jgi:hypothetical protein